MTIRNTLAVLATAVILSLLAYVVGLSSRLPEPVAYFAIALLAASVTPLLASSQFRAQPVRKSQSQPKQSQPKQPGTRTAAAKETGSVKWFSASKGFGFITRDNGEDIFVHFRSIAGSGHRILREGQRVEFTVSEGSKGLQAEDVMALR